MLIFGLGDFLWETSPDCGQHTAAPQQVSVGQALAGRTLIVTRIIQRCTKPLPTKAKSRPNSILSQAHSALITMYLKLCHPSKMA